MEAGDDRLAWRAHDVIIRPWSRMEMGARVVEDAVDYDGLVAREAEAWEVRGSAADVCRL